MIAPVNLVPVVRHSHGRLLPLDSEWLVESIAHAATRNGRSLWWAQQVGRAILAFLKDDAPGATLSPREITSTVRDVLERVGAPEVARSFQILPPRVRVSLWRIVRECGGGFELAFYRRLRDTLTDALSSRVSVLEICDSRAAIKLLCARRRWRSRCRDAERELLSALEDILSRIPRAHGIRIEVT
jgi:hypothetical protein